MIWDINNSEFPADLTNFPPSPYLISIFDICVPSGIFNNCSILPLIISDSFPIEISEFNSNPVTAGV